MSNPGIDDEGESMERCREAGWKKIGITDKSERRSLWVRCNVKDDCDILTSGNIESFELCAGREGDDDYVIIEPSNPQFREIYDVIRSAIYATEIDE